MLARQEGTLRCGGAGSGGDATCSRGILWQPLRASHGGAARLMSKTRLSEPLLFSFVCSRVLILRMTAGFSSAGSVHD